jgi:hypothetical protein
MLNGVQAEGTMVAPPLHDWKHAPLFAGHFSGSLAVESLSADVQSGGNSAAPSSSALAALTPQPTSMFASHFASASQ